MPATLPKSPVYLRTAIARGIQSETPVDREAKVIRGFTVASLGSPEGHDFTFDATTLEQIVEKGNAAKIGLKSRFTHPSLSGDGLGKFLGRAKTFRLDGDKVRADLYLAKSAFNTPDGDLATYVMDLAEEDPESFGASLHLKTTERFKQLQRVNSNGDEPLRIETLKAVDAVDDPATGDSFLHTPQSEGYELLDQMFAGQTGDVISARVGTYLNTYFASRGLEAMATDHKDDATKAKEAAALKEKEAAELKEKEAAALKEKEAAELAAKEAAAAKAKEAEESEPVALSAAELDELIDKKVAERLEESEQRSQEVLALCETASCVDKARDFIKRGLSLSAVKGELFDLLEKRKSAGDGGEDPELTAADENKKFKQEFAKGREVYLANGITEDDFVATRRIDAGLDALEPGKKQPAEKESAAA